MQRASTLKDARMFGWMPGYSGINSVIHEYFLSKWKSDQRVLSALTLGRKQDEPDELFLKRLDTDAYSQADKARDQGKLIHQAIEQHFNNEGYDPCFRPHVNAVLRMLSDNFPDVTDWVSERTFACRHGYGGAIDLYSPSARIIIDYKGADVAPNERKKLAYSQHRQLAAYANGLGWLPGFRGVNLFVSRSHPGHIVQHEWKREELDEGLDTFLAAAKIWRNTNKYDPRW